MVRVCEDTFGKAINPSCNSLENIRRFTISNRCMSVQVITYGAIITSIKVPDAHGHVADIVLGYDSVDGYQTLSNPYFGAVIGRVCSPVANGQFTLNGRTVQLTRNFLGKHQSNGGFIGFDKVIWDVHRVRADGVVFSFCSPDGHEGYPGQLLARATYTLTQDNCLRFCLEATTNKPTPINMSNQVFFNLAGHDAGRGALCEHMAMIRANRIIVVDDETVPTGGVIELDHHPLDLRRMKNICAGLKRLLPKGYDHTYVLDWKPNAIRKQAQVYHPGTGRWMEISSNQPCMQFSTAPNLPDVEGGEEPKIFGKDGARYTKYGSFCMQTQAYPNAVNVPTFPSIIVHPGEKYQHICIYKFGIVPVRGEPEEESRDDTTDSPPVVT